MDKEKRKNDYVHKNILMKVIGEHPHSGEYCHPIGESASSVGTTVVCGTPMYLVVNVNTNDRYYAARENLTLINKPDEVD